MPRREHRRELTIEEQLGLHRYMLNGEDVYYSSHNDIMRDINSHDIKQSHWMWYGFPDDKYGLKETHMGKTYVLNQEEAVAYLKDDHLAGMLIERFRAIRDNGDPEWFFQDGDFGKFTSSIDLFYRAADHMRQTRQENDNSRAIIRVIEQIDELIKQKTQDREEGKIPPIPFRMDRPSAPPSKPRQRKRTHNQHNHHNAHDHQNDHHNVSPAAHRHPNGLSTTARSRSNNDTSHTNHRHHTTQHRHHDDRFHSNAPAQTHSQAHQSNENPEVNSRINKPQHEHTTERQPKHHADFRYTGVSYTDRVKGKKVYVSRGLRGKGGIHTNEKDVSTHIPKYIKRDLLYKPDLESNVEIYADDRKYALDLMYAGLNNNSTSLNNPDLLTSIMGTVYVTRKVQTYIKSESPTDISFITKDELDNDDSYKIDVATVTGMEYRGTPDSWFKQFTPHEFTEFNRKAYKKAFTNLLKVADNGAKDGTIDLLLPPFGLGVYLPPNDEEAQGYVKAGWVKALKESIAEYKGKNKIKIHGFGIGAKTGEGDGLAPALNALNSKINFHDAGNADMLFYYQQLRKRGGSMLLGNAGDPCWMLAINTPHIKFFGDASTPGARYKGHLISGPHSDTSDEFLACGSNFIQYGIIDLHEKGLLGKVVKYIDSPPITIYHASYSPPPVAERQKARSLELTNVKRSQADPPPSGAPERPTNITNNNINVPSSNVPSRVTSPIPRNTHIESSNTIPKPNINKPTLSQNTLIRGQLRGNFKKKINSKSQEMIQISLLTGEYSTPVITSAYRTNESEKEAIIDIIEKTSTNLKVKKEMVDAFLTALGAYAEGKIKDIKEGGKIAGFKAWKNNPDFQAMLIKECKDKGVFPTKITTLTTEMLTTFGDISKEVQKQTYDKFDTIEGKQYQNIHKGSRSFRLGLLKNNYDITVGGTLNK